MPQLVPQALKALSTIAMQPKVETPRINAIICMDLAGKGTGDIARELGLTVGRVSIIKGSPLYKDARDRELARLKDMYRDKQTDRLISGDPVEEALKDAALEAARTKIELMHNGKSEFVKLAASGDILDRAGYRAHQEKTRVSVEISDKIADRFERALAGAGPEGAPSTVVRVTSEAVRG